MYKRQVNSLGRGRLQEILALARQRKVDLVTLQATRWLSAGTFRIAGWTALSLQAAQGVDGILVAIRAPQGTPRDRTVVPGRILEVRWRHFQVPIVLLACYAPGEHRLLEVRNSF